MLLRRLTRPWLRYAFHLFYNPFAFTYDIVSAIVSRGRWRAWTRAALPRIAGTRVLELPCGTGNLLVDISAAGHAPVGVDLSTSMLRITRSKLRRHAATAALARARVQDLPFPSRAIDTVVMTFPPEFIYDPRAFAEFYRVLDQGGRVVWVDAGRLLPRDAWGKFLNAALDAVSGGAAPSGHFSATASDLLAVAGFKSQLEWVQDETSVVAVLTAIKGSKG